jgi:hypothetical protein
LLILVIAVGKDLTNKGQYDTKAHVFSSSWSMSSTMNGTAESDWQARVAKYHLHEKDRQDFVEVSF